MEHSEENDRLNPSNGTEKDPDPAAAPRLAEAEHAKATHYAYDPETYEVLCRPGQRLTPKKAQRLQELDLYAHVVTSPK